MSSNTDGTTPFLSSDNTDDLDLDLDLEALSSKACALASVPVPNYAESIQVANRASQKKYGNRFTIGDDEEDDDEDDEDHPDDKNGIVLAERTSQILSNFQDYVSGIGGLEDAGSAGKEILESSTSASASSPSKANAGMGSGSGIGGDDTMNKETVTLSDMAAGIRSGNKEQLIGGRRGGSESNNSDTGSNRYGPTKIPPLTREWSYNAKNSTGGNNNLHDANGSGGGGGIDSWEDPEALYLSRGQQYTHPLMPSRRVKIGLLNCIVMSAIVLGVSLGVAKSASKSGQELGTKVDELEEDLKKIAESGAKDGPAGLPVNSEMSPPKHNLGDNIPYVVVKPTTSGESSAAKIVEAYEHPLLTKEQQYMYQNTLAKYLPKEFDRRKGWMGKTYEEAVEFCAKVEPSDPSSGFTYEICPYEATCPLGPDSQPLGGFKDSVEGNTWAPISNQANDWVQMSEENACTRISAENQYPPEWGLSGVEDSEMTSHVRCCVSEKDLTGLDDNSMLLQITHDNAPNHDQNDPDIAVYEGIASEYLPLEFDRSKGWTGRTYIEALQFCGSMNGYEICPYEAICPFGPDHAPLGGFKTDYDGSWVPILDSANNYVQVGETDPCIKYSNEHGTPAQWSVTGIDDEQITRHIMCCLLNEKDIKTNDDTALPMAHVVTSEEQNAAAAKQAQEKAEKKELMAKYEAAAKKYLPVEYNRDNGWTGRTYAQAHYFCSELRLNGRNYGICPYEAVCPGGHDTQPLGGFQNGGMRQMWLPISNDVNDWVQMAEVDSCIKFSAENPDLPEWGITGKDSEEITGYIQCCAESTIPEGVEVPEDKKQKFETEMAYKQAAQTFTPVQHTREQGWTGQTYLDAVEFCGNHDGLSLCPYAAICPMGPGEEPLGGYRDAPNGSWIPILESTGEGNEWVNVAEKDTCIQYTGIYPTNPVWGVTGEDNEDMTRHITCCAYVEGELGELPDETGPSPPHPGVPSFTTTIEEQVTDVEDATFVLDMEEFNPLLFNRENGWSGQTYLEAIQFCESLAVEDDPEGTYEICPYDAICPLGGGGVPMGGYEDDVGGLSEAWVPISDNSNEWTNLSKENSCVQYTGVYPDRPEWGRTGEGNEELTRNIMCCKGSIWGSAAESFLYELASEKYQPVWHNRNSGWVGQTYDEAVEFCESDRSFSLCPFEALCPMAELDAPLGGIIADEPGQWAPISNFANGYVSVGPDNTCKIFHVIFGQDWEEDRAGNDEATRHVMCCETGAKGDPDEEEAHIIEEEQETDASETTPSVEDQIAVSIKPEPQIEDAYDEDAERFHPVLYNRDDGWSGKTYLEAVQFCASLAIGDDPEGTYEICPYGAICPLGQAGEPLGGYEDGVGGLPAWVPISDESNGWLNLGKENSCVRYTALFPDPPEWGRTGEGSEELTRNIMCCKGSIWGSAEESFLYEVAAKKYHPVWHTRDNGWEGQTYDEAVEFCEMDRRFSLCPMEALCPMADLDAPLGGVIDKEGPEQWAPISNAPNSWVSVGPDNTCQIFEVLNGKNAQWGFTGEGAEPLTRHVMCCETGAKGDPDEEEAHIVEEEQETEAVVTPKPTPLPTSQPTIATAPPSPKPTPAPSNPPVTSKPTNKPVLQGAIGTAVQSYKNAEKYKPVWYDRSSGWTGETYDEAFEFCSSKGDMHDLCPYSVICPAGPLNLPYSGSRSEQLSWAPVNEPFNSWVQVSSLQVCVKYENLNPEDKPSWGLTGIGSEDLTRHVLCCEMDVDEGSSNVQSGNSMMEAYGYVVEKYAPKWFDRSEGWSGKSYADALAFCSIKDSYIPCPYEAYCPLGPGSLPTGGYDGTEEAWAAMIDAPNSWVQIGSYEKNDMSNSCMKWNDVPGHDTPPMWGLKGNSDDDITPNIMCCKEPENHFIDGMDPTLSEAVAISKSEQEILEKMHPVWFGRKHGYHGKTWQGATDFCQSMGDMVLCPRTAYCPSQSDSGSDKPLFLQKPGFDKEQWAPAASEFNTGREYWISIGKNPTTCSTHEELLATEPEWTTDGSQSDLKEHVLCCQNPKHLAKQQTLKDDLSPIWMDSKHGWDGGTHEDAMEFCDGFGNRKVCPYTAYCPHGPGQQVMGGHKVDFVNEGEQWAPVYGQTNKWVMIGMKYQNIATMCMDSQQLEGGEPDWGAGESSASMQKFIMCCDF